MNLGMPNSTQHDGAYDSLEIENFWQQGDYARPVSAGFGMGGSIPLAFRQIGCRTWTLAHRPHAVLEGDIMDQACAVSAVQRIVFMKGSQVGGTECGNNWIGYVIHIAPGPMMAVAPTVELAKRHSKQRIDPLLAGCAGTARACEARAFTG
jgi:hypothetical protein